MRLTAAALAFLAIPVLTHADSTIPVGTWKAVKYISATETSQSDAYIKRFLNKKLVVTQTSIRFAGDRCKIQSQQELKTDEEATQFFLKEKIDYSALGIHAPVAYVDADCSFIVVGSAGEVLFNWDGNTYLMRRVEKRN